MKATPIGNNTRTSTALRLLAAQIDNDEAPDFVFLFLDDENESYNTVSKSEEDGFLLLGLLDYTKKVILERMDYEEDDFE